ncbi:MAG: glucose-1-phosphate adenylyltransferase subunit GlgD [Paenibacillaceae bacterium]|nr:glucose-1-phosphate adenylyltransferase subunit GlgD [Paenibacillaceae bacterium]
MKHMMGVINCIQERVDLGALTAHRCVAAVPFGGRYRLIDFVLSNMVNSGIEDVAVLTEDNVRPLMDHLGSGKEWDLDRKRGGLFVLPSNGHGKRASDIEQLRAHRDFFHRGTQEYVVIARSHIVCNVDLRRVLHAHEQSGADVTALYYCTTEDVDASFDIDAFGRIAAMHASPKGLVLKNAPIDVYMMRKSWLLDVIDEPQGAISVEQRILERLHDVRVYAYCVDAYVGIIDSITSYYRHSMALLQPDVLRELFFRGAPIYTKVKDEPPTKYADASHVHNALIANGCIINGCVENSIIFRGVRIHAGAVVRNSIVMQNGEISEHAHVQHAILDKEVYVEAEHNVVGTADAPHVVPKKKVHAIA